MASPSPLPPPSPPPPSPPGPPSGPGGFGSEGWHVPVTVVVPILAVVLFYVGFAFTRYMMKRRNDEFSTTDNSAYIPFMNFGKYGLLGAFGSSAGGSQYGMSSKAVFGTAAILPATVDMGVPQKGGEPGLYAVVSGNRWFWSVGGASA